ncbi:DUF5753 domain-containing protein [Micromonospora zhanjiangensis]|uniref:DUF5753 domain-containing protein n=1 Tax=Micromonospora zhanjiangensis TaxID=1522057 RepID=A0ABV8KVC7_9ACTN
MNHFLRQAMHEAGHTYESLAYAVEVHPKTVLRWVSGGRTPHPRQRVVVAKTLRRDINDLWPDEHRNQAFLPWIEAERRATTLRSFQLAFVPGLLQTEAYARAVLTTARPDLDCGQVEELVVDRMERQRVLISDRPPHCTFVIDEAALRRGSPGVMGPQLARLLDPGSQVALHVVPLSAGFYAGQAGPFALATVESRDMGYLEYPGSGHVTHDVEPLTRLWEGVRSVALPVDQTRDLIARMVSEL